MRSRLESALTTARGTRALEEIDYAKVPLAAERVREIVEAAGSVAAVLNSRHALAKERGWVTSPPSPDDFARAVTQEPNLLRRPLLLIGDKLIIGFDRDAYAQLTGAADPGASKPGAARTASAKPPSRKPGPTTRAAETKARSASSRSTKRRG